MSCCHDCAQTGGNCGGGLAGLMGALLAPGSTVRVGFAYEVIASRDEVNQGLAAPAHIQNTIVNTLVEGGVFDWASVIVSEPWLGGSVADGYLTIQGTTRAQQNDPNDIGNIVQSVITQYLPAIRITRRDPVVVDAIPAAVVGRSDVAQVNAQQYAPNQQQSGQCNWDTQSFGDYVACQLGITSPIGGIAAGTVGGIAAAGLLALFALVLLKRF